MALLIAKKGDDDQGFDQVNKTMISRNAGATSVEMMPGLLRRTLVEGKSIMVCEYTFAPGVEAPSHSHPHEQVGYVVLGKIHITIDGRSLSWEQEIATMRPQMCITAYPQKSIR